MKQILLTGTTGQLGQELRHTLVPLGKVTAVGRSTLDLAQLDTIRPLMEALKPDLVVNTAAYTAVDRAETEPEQANIINAIAPGVLAQEAQRIGAALIHISTDYVFDGQKSFPYTEQDSPNPVNVYGQSKLAGEKAIQQVQGCCHIILRTAWVYGTHGNNFVKTMLKLGAERPEIRVVADQIGSPTWTGDLARAVAQLIPHLSQATTGTYHYTNSGVASWYDFANTIFAIARQLDLPLKVQHVIPIPTTEYPTPARRPAYSVLNCAKLSAVLGTAFPHWQQGLKQMLTQLHDRNYESVDSLWR